MDSAPATEVAVSATQVAAPAEAAVPVSSPATASGPTQAGSPQVADSKPAASGVAPPRPEPIRVGSLHVADLKPTVTESVLYEFFREVGDNVIASVRVCRDSQTSASLGYAYVNFHNEKDAQRALEDLNYQPIDGRACRISWSHRDPSGRRSGEGNVFVKHLDSSIEHQELHELFSPFGDIVSCKVSTDRVTGASRGYGFVQFKNPENAKKAIESLNGKFVNKSKVFVGPFVPRAKRPNSNKANFTNVYLKEFNPELTSEKFEELLCKATEEFGKITSPFLMTTKKEDGTVVSRGFGFANFESHEVAEKALERFNDQEKMKELVPEFLHPSADLYAAKAMSKEERRRMHSQGPINRNLYVRNIAETITEDQLSECFAKFGKLASPAKIMVHPDNKASKGFGFVCFEKSEDAREAITKMNGQLLEGKPLYVAIAQPKEQRRQQLQQQFQNRGMMMSGFYPGFPGMPAPGRFPGNPARGNYATRGGRGFAVPSGPQGMTRAVPYAQPQASRNDSLRASLQRTPDENKVQALGDILFSTLVSMTSDDLLARRVVGMVLGSHQGKPLDETVPALMNLLEDRTALNDILEKTKRAMAPTAQ